MLKRVFFLLPSLQAGGAERVILTIMQHLDRKQFAPTLVVMQNKGRMAAEYSSSGIPIIDLNTSGYVPAVCRVIALIRRERPAVLVSSIGPYNAILSPFLFLCRNTLCIARETNIPSRIHSLKIAQGKHLYRVIRRLYRHCYANYAVIIAQSNDMRADLIRAYRIPAEKIVRIHNPLDTAVVQYKAAGYAPEAIAAAAAGAPLQLLTVGRLTYQKGLDMLIPLLARMALPFCLHVVGDGDQRASLQRLTEACGIADSVVFYGFQSNPYPYMKAADVLLLPSRTEGFPNVLLEGLSLGTPVLANDCQGGIREIILPGFNGDVVDLPNCNASMLQQHITTVAALRQNSAQIQQYTQQSYGLEAIIPQYEAVLRQEQMRHE